MRRLISRRPSPAFVLSIIALFVVLGGTSYALSGSELNDRSVNAKKVKKNTLTNVEIDESKLKPVREANGLTYWAVVAANGSANRASGAVSASRLGAGNYEVIFKVDVRVCAYSATIGDIGAAQPADGQIKVSHRSTNVNGVQVRTDNSSGQPADRPFHLMISC